MKQMFAGAVVLVATAITAIQPAQAAPVLEIDAQHGPTVFEAGGPAEYSFNVRNVGDGPAQGPIELTVDLPAGVTTRFADVMDNDLGLTTTTVTSAWRDWSCRTGDTAGESSVTCTWSFPYTTTPQPLLPTGGLLPTRVTVFVDVPPAASGPLVAEATVTGAGLAATEREAALVGSPLTAFGIDAPSTTADAYMRDGEPVRQAGAHPARAVAGFDFLTRNVLEDSGDPTRASLRPIPIESARNLDALLPRGFVGDPTAVDECNVRQLVDLRCPAGSQIGVVDFGIPSYDYGNTVPANNTHASVYNMEPFRGTLATFAFQVLGRVVNITAHLDPRDNSVVAKVRDINEQYPAHYQKLTLWGVPGDPLNDPDRLNPNGGGQTWGQPFTGPRKPFLTLPSQCSVADTTDFRLSSWQNPSAWTSTLSTAPIQLSGCNKLIFQPSIEVAPDTKAPDAPTGLQVDIDLPQDDNPAGLGTPPLKDAEVALPAGMSINPAAADGLAACSDDQLGLKTDSEVSCPDGAKIGTVVARSPALEEPIEGSVYIRSQNSDDPASGEMFRMAIVMTNEERGLIVKLPGSVSADPQSGRLVTRFEDNPQLPVSSIRVRLKGGSRAPLATPPTCGAKTTTAELSSWGGQVSNLTDSFTIDCPGGDAFSPGFDAGATTPTAGAFSPFVALIDRADREQYLSGIEMEMPKGLLAKLNGVELCPDSLASDGTPGGCPAGSKVGTATVGAGSGSPFYLQGPVYLTGPYQGAPYGLSVQVPAKAGPFDLGIVKVRQALHVDRSTAAVRVVSDPLPQIVKGVPARLRTADVDIDRPGFIVNPTSCTTKQIAAKFTSAQGAVSGSSQRFRVGDCQALPFEPKLALALTGRKQTRTGKHPGVKAIVRQTGIGEAGIQKAKVTLPKALALDPDNAQALCEYQDGIKPDLENHCPNGSIVGTAKATTPLLDKPLTGKVYFVKNVRTDKKTGNQIRTLPMIVVALRGQIAINLKGESSTAKTGQLVNTFASVPDAPITQFNLNIAGGNTGILAITRTRQARINLCTNPTSHRANVQISGHNGKQATYPTTVKTPCKASNASKKARKAMQGRRS